MTPVQRLSAASLRSARIQALLPTRSYLEKAADHALLLDYQGDGRHGRYRASSDVPVFRAFAMRGAGEHWDLIPGGSFVTAIPATVPPCVATAVAHRFLTDLLPELRGGRAATAAAAAEDAVLVAGDFAALDAEPHLVPGVLCDLALIAPPLVLLALDGVAAAHHGLLSVEDWTFLLEHVRGEWHDGVVAHLGRLQKPPASHRLSGPG